MDSIERSGRAVILGIVTGVCLLFCGCSGPGYMDAHLAADPKAVAAHAAGATGPERAPVAKVIPPVVSKNAKVKKPVATAKRSLVTVATPVVGGAR